MIETGQIQFQNKHTLKESKRPMEPTILGECHMQFLSALEQGWVLARTELVPSWDQHGLIYRVTLQHPGTCDSQQLVLPQGWISEILIRAAEFKAESTRPLSQPYLWYG